MRTIVRLAALTVLGSAAAAGLTLAATASSASAATRTSTFEAQVVSHTNAARVRAGCEKLRVSRTLAKPPSHTRGDARKDFFSHTGANGSRFTQRAKRAGFTAQPMGENIAWGYKNAAGVTRGWLKSPGHRRNMLNCTSTLIASVRCATRTASSTGPRSSAGKPLRRSRAAPPSRSAA